ncbi:hypothetical protein Rhopal_004136-T1 [Rhodotorula paludigena]|uniref:Uncharacterized protein n=1 Tax=Rhodotorula paludigena TaxID=86838 RepID=A0AAV5GR16_9BASI|nr:hypothetical protein Rhopal_004136-T1 [Rhodotorula paludigena]
MTTHQPQPGVLHHVAPWPHVSAFEFGPRSSPSDPLVLFVGGLGDTLLSVQYLGALAVALREAGWGLAQANLTSSGMGWGGATVAGDAEEIAKIVRYFLERGTSKVVLVGHSTGCQDAIAYLHLASAQSFPKLAGIILQAPVSDREIDVVTELAKKVADEAAALATPPNPTDLAPASCSKLFHSKAGVTWQRWRSLAELPDSDDVDVHKSEDFFSASLSDRRLANVFAPLNCPLSVVLSGDDSSYPSSVKANLPGLLERFKRAAPQEWWHATSRIIDGGKHDLGGEPQTSEFVGLVVEFVKSL